MPAPDDRDRSAGLPLHFEGQDAYDALSAALADAVLIVEQGGDVAYAGPGLHDVLGLDPSEIEGRPLLDFVHPEDAVQKEAGGFWNASLPSEREFRMRAASGAWVWVRGLSSATDRAGNRPEAVERVLGSHTILLVRDRPHERGVRDAADLIHEAFDAVNNLVVVTDVRVRDNPIVVVNQNFVGATGYERDEIVGRNCRFLQVRPDGTRDDAGGGQGEALEEIRAATAEGRPATVVLRNYRKDGTLFHNRLFLTPIRNGAGTVTHFVGVQNDVTEEIAQSIEADRQRHLLQSFFDSAPFLMGVVELRDGAVCHRAANAAAVSLFRSNGAVFDAVEAASLIDLGFTEAEAATWRRHVEACAETGEPVHFETRFPWGSAEDAEGARSLTVVLNAADESEPLFSYVAEDVTEVRRAERARRLLAAAVEQAAEPIVVTDAALDEPGPRIVYANDAHRRVFGYEAHELLGQTPRLFQGPKSDRAVLDRVRQKLEGGEPVQAETINYRKDGSEFILQWEIAPVRDEDGAIVNWVGTQRDVTERRHLERQLLEVAAREQERMARELHDGLAQVLSGSAFKLQALRGTLDRLGHDDISAEVERVREHVADALSQARAIARGLFPVNVDPDGLMVALERLALDVEEDYGIDCSFTFETPVLVRTDEQSGHLYRIAQEAIANAVRHGQAGSVLVDLFHDDGRSVLTVQDDGVGITDEALEQEGGLGLRTMQYRAERIGGQLEVRRRERGGTVVTVRFDPEAEAPAAFALGSEERA